MLDARVQPAADLDRAERMADRRGPGPCRSPDAGAPPAAPRSRRLRRPRAAPGGGRARSASARSPRRGASARSATNERSILSTIEREALEVAEAGVAGAEVVERQRDAHVVQRLERGCDLLDARAARCSRSAPARAARPAGRCRRGCGRPASARSGLASWLAETLTASRSGGSPARPAGGDRAGLGAAPIRPIARDLAAGLGELDQGLRLDRPEVGVMPAQQGLDAADALRPRGRAAADTRG